MFAVDVTTWPRCDAECSPSRGYYYHPSRHSAGQPIIAGWAFQWIAHPSNRSITGWILLAFAWAAATLFVAGFTNAVRKT